jgi:hypothetical protein
MVEVDKTTKSVFDLIEKRAANGTEAILQTYKEESNAALHGATTQLQNFIQEVGKNVIKETSRLDRKVDDLLDDVSDQLVEIKEEISKTQKEHLEVIQENISSSHKEHLEVLQENLSISIKVQLESLQDNINATQKENLKGLNDSIISARKELINSSYTIENIVSDNANILSKLSSNISKATNDFDVFGQTVYKNYMLLLEQINSISIEIKPILEQEQRLEQRFVNLENEIRETSKVKQDIQYQNEKLDIIQQHLQWANLPFYKKWFKRREF